METCLGFHIDCGILVKGVGVTAMAFILFVGSVYLILTAVFGRWMAYLVVMVTLAGWLIVLSALWAFGFYSQGPDTPVNLGPRGAEPAWVPLLASTGETSDRYETFRSYPDAPWKEPAKSDTADVQSVTGIVTEFLAEEANAELEIDPLDPKALTGVDFAVDQARVRDRRGHEARRRAGPPPRRRAALDGVALLRQGERPEVLPHVPGRLDHLVRDPSAPAGHRGEEAQGLPHPRGSPALVRTRMMRSMREEVGA